MRPCPVLSEWNSLLNPDQETKAASTYILALIQAHCIEVIGLQYSLGVWNELLKCVCVVKD